MSADEFYKFHWKAMQVVEWVHPRTNEVVQCAILALDFDCHTMKLIPVAHIGYDEKEFHASIDLIRRIPKHDKNGIAKLKLA